MTDVNGEFSVEGEKGYSFAIEKMVKEGYVKSTSGVKYNFYYSSIYSGAKSSMYHSADPSQPVIYEMWKKGETEPLIKQSVEFIIDSRKGINEMYYSFKLGAKPSAQPMNGWDLKVTGKNIRSLDQNSNEDYWEVTLTAGDGGGVVLTDSSHANFAPEEGYQKSLTIKSTDQEHPRLRKVRRAYFRVDNGEKYAAFKLDLNFGTLKTGERIYVKFLNFRINPNGSRNLEYDKSKRIE